MTWTDYATIAICLTGLWGLLVYGEKRRAKRSARAFVSLLQKVDEEKAKLQHAQIGQDTETATRRANLTEVPSNMAVRCKAGPKGFDRTHRVDRYGVPHRPDRYGVNADWRNE